MPIRNCETYSFVVFNDLIVEERRYRVPLDGEVKL